MATAPHPALTSSRASALPNPLENAQPTMGMITEEDEEVLRRQRNPKPASKNENEEANTRATKPPITGDASGGKFRSMNRSRVKIPRKQRSTTLRLTRRRLSGLLDRLTAAHRWREASAVLSVLFAGNPRSYSPSEDRRNFLIAMELLKRSHGRGNLHNLIKSTYEVWMSKLPWHKKGHKKKQLLQLELALFYLSQEKFAEALCYTRFLVSDDFGSEPFINLIHGLILYQLWYADLPEEMQIKGFDVHTSNAHGMPSSDGYRETEICESSNGHDAVDIENAKASFQCSSESSVGNEKILMDRKGDVCREKSSVAFSVQEFHICQMEDDEERGQPTNQDNTINTSIYFAPGLDKSLLPIQLKLLAEDPVQSILLYRKLANEKYRDAVKHLRLALHSTPPLFSALLPLIQLLLLGDLVDEAIIELDKSCHLLDSALPFRLKARLLQCFRSSQITMITSCYENALKKDPTCNYSMEKLIKMHKTGNYSAILLLDMLAMHLDAVDGKYSIWEEFASCFLELQTTWLFDYEDCISTNIDGVKDRISSHRIPRMFTEGEAKDTWRLRCRWWASRHFNRNKYLSEIQAGEWMLLQFKAACATHLYGPNFEYVAAVLSSLTQTGNSNIISYLHMHIKNPLNLGDTLAARY